jgi:hypothetical protein
MPTPYYFHIKHGITVNAAVRVNGITIHHGSSSTQDGIAGPIAHLLEPGENHLEVEIRHGDPTHGSAFFFAGILLVSDDTALAKLDWPADFPALPPPAPPFPTLQIRPLVIPADHPKPLFADALVERVPLEGTDETWAPIRALYDAFERGDAHAIAELTATRAAEAHKFYDLPETTPAGAAQMASENVGGPFDMLPLYGGQVVFRECAGGRAVQLLRLDGRPALAGRCRANPKQGYLSNPVLVRRGGAYHIMA